MSQIIVTTGGGGGATTFADDVFRVYDNVDNTKLIAFEADQITSGQTRTITMCDQDLSLIAPSFPGDVTTGGNFNMPVTNAALTEGVLEINSVRMLHAYGVDNIFIGPDSGNGTNTGTDNTGIGYQSLESLTSGINNVAIGSNSSPLLTDGQRNVSIGAESLLILTSGDNNVAIGEGALETIATGNENVAIGVGAGINLTLNDSSNVLIGSLGVVGDNNTIRIGEQGAGAGQQDTCYVAGIHGVTPAGATETVIIDANGQLGSTTSPGSEFTDDLFRVLDDGDNTKELAFECSSITAATTRTITMCDQDLSLISPSFPGDVSTGGNFNLPTTNAALTEGVIEVNGTRWAHSYGTNNTFIGSGTGNGTLSGATGNVGVGTDGVLASLTSGDNNTGLGHQVLQDVTTGTNNSAFGTAALRNVVDGVNNIGFGLQACTSLTSGQRNTGVGVASLISITSGSYNTAIGEDAGGSLTGSDSDNVLIRNNGTAGDNNTIRIGEQGTGVGQQNRCYIAGIYNTTPAGGVDGTVVIDSNGQLGSIAGAAPMDRVDATGATQAMAVNTEYTTNYGSGSCTYTLPSAAAVGDVIEVWGNSSNGWSIAQNAGQTIHILGSSTTTGVGGSLASTTQYDCIRLKCTVADTDFVGIPTGNITIA